jgi:hypothetical protein
MVSRRHSHIFCRRPDCLAVGKDDGVGWSPPTSGLAKFADGLGLAVGEDRCLPMAEICRWLGRRQIPSLPLAEVCRWLGRRRNLFADGFALPSAKPPVCRWLIRWPSADPVTVGEQAVSGSDESSENKIEPQDLKINEVVD